VENWAKLDHSGRVPLISLNSKSLNPQGVMSIQYLKEVRELENSHRGEFGQIGPSWNSSFDVVERQFSECIKKSPLTNDSLIFICEELEDPHDGKFSRIVPLWKSSCDEIERQKSVSTQSHALNTMLISFLETNLTHIMES
jgi:hypothetical protein